jgi:hypothetical protein
MKRLWIALLVVCPCSASIVVDQSQAWFTDGIEFHWILETNYGYEPIDLEGRIVSGLTDGAIVWLVDDSPSAPGMCCQPGPPQPPPPPTPRTPVTVTPEPATLLIMGAGLLALAALSRQHQIFLSSIPLYTYARFQTRAQAGPRGSCAILKEGKKLCPGTVEKNHKTG